MDQSVIANADLARKLINSIQDDISDKDFKEGISFLDVKNDTLLSYLIDVCNIVLRKIKEESIADHASVDRCIEYRVMLEKMKAIDQKLTYQINKLIALPENAEAQISERVNVQNLDIELDSDSDEKDDDNAEDEDKVSDEDEVSPSEDLGEQEGDGFVASKHGKKDGPESKGVYKPPKFKSAVYSDGVPSKRARFEDDFEFESDNEIFDGLQMNSEEKAKLDYEEDNFTRLRNSNAKQKQKQKQKQKKGKKLKKHRR